MSNPLDSVATTEPDRLTSGDTWMWKRTDLDADYPLASWALSYAAQLEGAAAAAKTFAAAEVDGAYVVTVPHTETANWTAGTYQWSAFMTRASDSARVTIGSGSFVVAANALMVNSDPRTHAQRMLDAIEALLENRATGNISSYSIAGRSVAKMTPEELTRWRTHYRNEVGKEKTRAAAARGRPTGRTSVVSFG